MRNSSWLIISARRVSFEKLTLWRNWNIRTLLLCMMQSILNGNCTWSWNAFLDKSYPHSWKVVKGEDCQKERLASYSNSWCPQWLIRILRVFRIAISNWRTSWSPRGVNWSLSILDSAHAARNVWESSVELQVTCLLRSSRRRTIMEISLTSGLVESYSTFWSVAISHSNLVSRRISSGK